ncbi:hypothetical protein WOLCODRAFT_84011 [Wolfiporia cocos MD-104 SS10]|uniref:Fungal-type protein kinase domain-containing protein n=1 Tax=Wolfiporia cocos (strain MD-104) TaxID=742152 RepID=A0A2H3J5J3_WOLCO|nr:hypothetical protein WOLCODRAFT_84011 [Wolfiporia cocos MD-104 SS10]
MAEHVLHGSGHQFATLFEADQCGSNATPDERKAIASRTVVEFSKPVEKFLENFVPSQTPCPRRYTRGIFQSAQGKDQKALSMGIALALEDLTKDFPSAKRLRLAYQGDRLIPLTVGEHTALDDQLRATIVSSFPGQSAAADPQWDKISLVVQVNPHLTYDPLGSDPAWEEGMLQILRAARNMLVVNHSLFVFVIGIYQNQARIFRVDHSSAVASKLFNFRRRPGLIRSFLWRFVHPSACTTVAGADPSVSNPTKRDLQWARKILGSTSQSPAIMNACRWFTVEDSAQRNAARHFLIFKPIFVSLTLFARATQVWEAIERGDKTGRRFVIKNAWRSCQEYDAETRIYQHLRNELSPGQQLFGVAEMVCGLDLGEAEVSNNSAAQESESTAAVSTPPVSRTRLTIRTPPQRNPRSGMQTRASKAILATRNKAEPAGHRTTCAFGRNNTSDAPCERSHMRLVIWPVGKSLVEFQSIRELTETLRDAIIGHEQLCDAGVLHRDISNENIMISTDARFKGFLCDFDLSVLLQELDSNPCATVSLRIALAWRAADDSLLSPYRGRGTLGQWSCSKGRDGRCTRRFTI